MKEVTIKIPESKLTFFMELMQQLGFEATQAYTISEEHITLVKDRIAQSEKNPERNMDWETAKKNLNLKS